MANTQERASLSKPDIPLAAFKVGSISKVSTAGGIPKRYTSTKPATSDGTAAGTTAAQARPPSSWKVNTRLQTRRLSSSSATSETTNELPVSRPTKLAVGKVQHDAGKVNSKSVLQNKRASSALSSRSNASVNASSSDSAHTVTPSVASKKVGTRPVSISNVPAFTVGNSNALSVSRNTSTPKRSSSQRAGPIAPQPTTTPVTRSPFSPYQQNLAPKREKASNMKSTSPGLSSNLQPTLPQLRKQTQLLHLFLIHSAGSSTTKAWESSAKEQFNTRFSQLQSTYRTLLILLRQARQYNNMLALHQWSGSNTVSLVRKCNTLLGVLSDLCALTSPGPDETLITSAFAVGTTGNLPPTPPEEDIRRGATGSYTALVQKFESWVAWVLDVWNDRDTEEEQRQKQPMAQDSQERYLEKHFTRIDGLGDSVKAELKRLMNVLNTLEARMVDLNSPQVPAYPLAPSAPQTSPEKRPILANDSAEVRAGSRATPMASIGPPISSTKNGEKAPRSATSSDNDDAIRDHLLEKRQGASTPWRLFDITTNMIRNMQEELQLMRELDFEVVIGEQAWLDCKSGSENFRLRNRLGGSSILHQALEHGQMVVYVRELPESSDTVDQAIPKNEKKTLQDLATLLERDDLMQKIDLNGNKDGELLEAMYGKTPVPKLFSLETCGAFDIQGFVGGKSDKAVTFGE